MERYIVNLEKTVQAHLWARADGPEQAIEAAKGSPEFPGEFSSTAFGNVSIVDEGGWRVESVTDATGAVVWRAGDEPVDGA